MAGSPDLTALPLMKKLTLAGGRHKFLLFSFASIATILGLVASFYFSFTLFAIPPMKILPDGGIYIIHRRPELNFIDSADAICVRSRGYVNLLCRQEQLIRNTTRESIVMRIPYLHFVYIAANNGADYER